MDGVLSTTVFPEEVDTVFELLLTVEDIVEEVTVSVADRENGNKATTNINDITLMTITLA